MPLSRRGLLHRWMPLPVSAGAGEVSEHDENGNEVRIILGIRYALPDTGEGISLAVMCLCLSHETFKSSRETLF